MLVVPFANDASTTRLRCQDGAEREVTLVRAFADHAAALEIFEILSKSFGSRRSSRASFFSVSVSELR